MSTQGEKMKKSSVIRHFAKPRVRLKKFTKYTIYKVAPDSKQGKDGANGVVARRH